MPQKYKPKPKGYNNYERSALTEAVKAVQSGAMSIRVAASHFCIPKSTLGDRLSGKTKIDGSSGRNPVLLTEVEDRIVQVATYAAQKGIGVSRKQLLVKTGRLCKMMNISTPFTNGVPGKGWLDGLMRRHPELTARKPEALGASRSRMMNPIVVGNYFRDLKKITADLNLTHCPEKIWNCDETGKQIAHTPQRVMAKKGTKNVVGKISDDRTNISILACVNAAGVKMPPMLIVKGKTQKVLESYNVMQAPEGTIWAFQENAWMSDEIGEEWFKKVFLKHCGTERPQLLILDGHRSHETLGILDLAIQENIHILSLPPHTTHYLQPLDRCVFGPFNKAYDIACDTFTNENPNVGVCKWNFPHLFSIAWGEAVNTKNITSAFQACGIYPCKEDSIPLSAFMPSSVSDKPTSIASSMVKATGKPLSAATASSDEKSVDAHDDQNADIPSTISDKSTLIASPMVKAMGKSTSATTIITRSVDQSVAFHDDQSISFGQSPLSSSNPSFDEGFLLSEVSLLENMSQGATPNNIPDDPQTLFGMILSGQIEVSTADECGVATFPNNLVPLDSSLSEVSKETSDSNTTNIIANWNVAVDNVFLPPVENYVQTPKSTTRQRTTSHRLLTTDDVINEKRQKLEEKEQKEREKEERKRQRELRQKIKKGTVKKEGKKLSKTKQRNYHIDF